MNVVFLSQIMESLSNIPRGQSQLMKRSSLVKRFRPTSYWRFTFELRVGLESSVDSCAKSGEQVLTE